MNRTLRLAAPLAAAALFFGLVSARADGPATVIHACRNGDHTVRLVDSTANCHSGETVVEWNVTGAAGPAGADGAAGPQGVAGEQGPAGPSNGYYRHEPYVDYGSSPFGSDVIQLSLPAGSYLVTGRAVTNSGGFCRLRADGVLPGFGDEAQLLDRRHEVLLGAVTLSIATTVSIRCDGGGRVSEPTLSAIRVGSLDDQSPAADW